jgi:hypothetical protein
MSKNGRRPFVCPGRRYEPGGRGPSTRHPRAPIARDTGLQRHYFPVSVRCGSSTSASTSAGTVTMNAPAMISKIPIHTSLLHCDIRAARAFSSQIAHLAWNIPWNNSTA